MTFNAFLILPITLFAGCKSIEEFECDIQVTEETKKICTILESSKKTLKILNLLLWYTDDSEILSDFFDSLADIGLKLEKFAIRAHNWPGFSSLYNFFKSQANWIELEICTDFEFEYVYNIKAALPELKKLKSLEIWFKLMNSTDIEIFMSRSAGSFLLLWKKFKWVDHVDHMETYRPSFLNFLVTIWKASHYMEEENGIVQMEFLKKLQTTIDFWRHYTSTRARTTPATTYFSFWNIWRNCKIWLSTYRKIAHWIQHNLMKWRAWNCQTFKTQHLALTSLWPTILFWNSCCSWAMYWHFVFFHVLLQTIKLMTSYQQN